MSADATGEEDDDEAAEDWEGKGENTYEEQQRGCRGTH